MDDFSKKNVGKKNFEENLFFDKKIKMTKSAYGSDSFKQDYERNLSYKKIISNKNNLFFDSYNVNSQKGKTDIRFFSKNCSKECDYFPRLSQPNLLNSKVKTASTNFLNNNKRKNKNIFMSPQKSSDNTIDGVNVNDLKANSDPFHNENNKNYKQSTNANLDNTLENEIKHPEIQKNVIGQNRFYSNLLIEENNAYINPTPTSNLNDFNTNLQPNNEIIINNYCNDKKKKTTENVFDLNNLENKENCQQLLEENHNDNIIDEVNEEIHELSNKNVTAYYKNKSITKAVKSGLGECKLPKLINDKSNIIENQDHSKQKILLDNINNLNEIPNDEINKLESPLLEDELGIESLKNNSQTQEKKFTYRITNTNSAKSYILKQKKYFQNTSLELKSEQGADNNKSYIISPIRKIHLESRDNTFINLEKNYEKRHIDSDADPFERLKKLEEMNLKEDISICQSEGQNKFDESLMNENRRDSSKKEIIYPNKYIINNKDASHIINEVIRHQQVLSKDNIDNQIKNEIEEEHVEEQKEKFLNKSINKKAILKQDQINSSHTKQKEIYKENHNLQIEGDEKNLNVANENILLASNENFYSTAVNFNVNNVFNVSKNYSAGLYNPNSSNKIFSLTSVNNFKMNNMNAPHIKKDDQNVMKQSSEFFNMNNKQKEKNSSNKYYELNPNNNLKNKSIIPLINFPAHNLGITKEKYSKSKSEHLNKKKGDNNAEKEFFDVNDDENVKSKNFKFVYFSLNQIISS